MLRQILATGDDPRLVKSRNPHSLRLVKLRILKCRYSKKTIQQFWRQRLLVNEDQI